MLPTLAETVRDVPERARPEPVMSDIHSPFTLIEPTDILPVVVAFPTMVDEAVERKPFMVSSDVVADPPYAG